MAVVTPRFFQPINGTITTAAVAQQIAGADVKRLGVFVQNPHTATENLTVGVTEQAPVTLSAGKAIELDTTQEVWVKAATAGHAYTAYLIWKDDPGI